MKKQQEKSSMNRKQLAPINLTKYSKPILICDTETIGHLPIAKPFDFSFYIYDQLNDRVLAKKCFIITNLYNSPYAMESSFSYNKLGFYQEQLTNKNKDFKKISIKQLQKVLTKMIKDYNITIFGAFNVEFDYNALNRLFEHLGFKSPIRQLNCLDIHEMAVQTIGKLKEYQEFCLKNQDVQMITFKGKENKFLTEKGKVRTKAESFNCFLLDNPHYQEEHTGLEDIKIEIEIFKKSKALSNLARLNKKVVHNSKEYDFLKIV